MWRQVFQPHGRLHEFIDAWQRCIGSLSSGRLTANGKIPRPKQTSRSENFLHTDTNGCATFASLAPEPTASVPHPAELRNYWRRSGNLGSLRAVIRRSCSAMKTIWFKTSLALTISAVSTYTLANGIAINEQSCQRHRAPPTPAAPRPPLDASTICRQPWPACQAETHRSQRRSQPSSRPRTTSARPTAPPRAASKGDSVPLAAVPFGCFSTPINEDFTFGLGITCPTASSTITKTASWAAPRLL